MHEIWQNSAPVLNFDDDDSEGGDNDHVPLTVSTEPRQRLVSALLDDEEAFRDLDFQYSSDDDEDDDDANDKKQRFGSDVEISPTTVIDKPQVPSIDSWMHAWAAGGGEGLLSLDDSSLVVHEDNQNYYDEEATASAASSDRSPTYLPVEPVPRAAAKNDDDNNVTVFTYGWAAVFFDNDLVFDYDDEDDDKSERLTPTVERSSICYVQLVREEKGGSGAALQLTDLDNRERRVPIACMRVEPVSRRAGHCLVLTPRDGRDGGGVSILPVHLPASFLAGGASGRHSRFLVDDGDGYAPQAQHQAVMHVRFGMDAALRASRCCF